MKKKMKILVLGIGPAQVDLLKFLSGNHTVHAISYTSEGEGRKYAQYFEVIDIKDQQAVLGYAKKHNIDLVYTVGSDLGMVTSAWVSDKLQLSSFVTPGIATLCHSKHLLREKLDGMEGNLDYKLLSRPADIGSFPFPFIIKPVDSQGQRGVFLIKNRDELEKKFASSLKHSTARKVIAETYIKGPEISVNAYVIDGQTEFAIISDRITWDNYSNGIIHKHRIPSEFTTEESKELVLQLVAKTVTKLGIKNGPVYFQIKLDNSIPKLIEVTPRLDGCHLWRLIKYTTGVNLLEITMEHLTGKPIQNISATDIATRNVNESWELEFICARPGEKFFRDNYDIVESNYHEWYYHNGEVVKPVNSVLEKCGYKINHLKSAIYERIPFNKPYLTGSETYYIKDAVQSGQLAGNGKYTKRCQKYFEQHYGFGKCLLTTSCTDALEMAAILLDIQEGDEVIMPSYTFVSTANAFVLRGAEIVFADSRTDNPGIDEQSIESLITERTKAIVPVHYAGFSCDMAKIMALAERYNLFVVEDAAQAIDSYFVPSEGMRSPLGSIGHLATFSFHETKNIISGEGGMLVVNDPEFYQRAEIVWEKGTDRAAFFRGEVDKYGWVDIGSSYLPSELTAAFLWAQIENLDKIQRKRKLLWDNYYSGLRKWAKYNGVGLPNILEYATNNAHIFYLICNSLDQRTKIIERLDKNGILAVFHYLSLHKSRFYKQKHDGRSLPQADRYADHLLRLPLFYELTKEKQQKVIDVIKSL